MTTAYILVAIRWEEKDLIASHGEEYIRYRESVPMFMPNGSTMQQAGKAANEPAAKKAA
jgi:hypothetical protein